VYTRLIPDKTQYRKAEAAKIPKRPNSLTRADGDDRAPRGTMSTRSQPCTAPPTTAPAFETPDNETLTQCGIALGVLTALTLAQGCSQPPGVDNPPGLQLSLALLGSVWLLRKKNLTLSRSISLALLGLSAGAFVGGAVQGWLRVDIVPLGALSSPSALVSEFGLLGIFAASAFLY
jgi:hypothetical protein